MSGIRRIVISGGPATGKTSIVAGLEQKGYRCFHEVSREIISREVARGTDIVPWQNLHAFSELVFEGRIQQFNQAQNQLQFYDRSLIDTLAYMHKDGLQVPKDWLYAAQTLRYNPVVFITPPWREIFENDHERRESWEQLLHIHEYLMSSYTDAGYEVCVVPKAPVTERIAFILNQL